MAGEPIQARTPATKEYVNDPLVQLYNQMDDDRDDARLANLLRLTQADAATRNIEPAPKAPTADASEMPRGTVEP